MGKNAAKNKVTNSRPSAVKTAPRRIVSSASADDGEEVEMDENDEVEETEGEETEAGSTEENPRKKKRGKRQILFMCVAHVKDLPQDMPERNLKAGQSATVMARIEVPTPKEDEEFDVSRGREQAKANFKTKFGVDAEQVDGPFYIRKGVGTGSTRKRETINSSIRKKVMFIPKQGEAIRRVKEIDWKCIVSFTDDPEIVEVYYDRAVDEKAWKAMAKKPQKPGRQYLPITALRDLKITKDNTGSMAPVSNN